MRKENIKKPYTIILALVAWFGLALQLYLSFQTTSYTGFSTVKTIVNFFSYFTILSNILVAITLTASVLSPGGSFFTKPAVQSAIAVYIFIVGLVYNLVLRGIWQPKGLQLISDNLLHVIVPLLYVIYWVLFTPRKILVWKNILPWLLFPAVYLAYSLIRGPGADWYPYPFIDVPAQGIKKVAINSFFVLLAILLVSLGAIVFNRSGSKKRLR